MADVSKENIKPEQIATQTTGEIVQPAPIPAIHEQHAVLKQENLEKSEIENDNKHETEHDDSLNPPHKRYRSEPHHTILLSNETETEVVVSPSQYVHDFLKGKTALSIIPAEARGKIGAVNANHGAAEAINLLSNNEILSAPVFDKELEAYVGFVDYLDMASLIVDIVQKLVKEHYPDTAISSLQQEQKDKLAHDAKAQFNSKKLFDISDLSKNNPFIPIHKSASLYQAMEILAKFGIHRVPITDDEQNIEAILSQSAVVGFLFSNLDTFSSKAKKLVSELLSNREKQTVLTIPETAPAFEAFELMLQNRVSAVGVVTDKGVLVGVVSGTDFKMAGPHIGSLSLFLNPVKELLDQSREQNTICLVPVVKATLQDTLGIVIESMEDNKVHRVFVVDEEDKPVCVLSMKDVLAEFLA